MAIKTLLEETEYTFIAQNKNVLLCKIVQMIMDGSSLFNHMLNDEKEKIRL